jgi:peptidoglycan/xylan/chitin deacetylase (PgdA/CDA1 family)
LGAVVLMYHRIGQAGSGDPRAEMYTVGPDTFGAHLDELLASRCQPLPFDAVADAWATGRPHPPKAVAVTFDDGHDSDISHALPALLERGLHAAFFVTPAWVGLPGFVSWPEVRELAAAGMAVGAHGLDHTALASLDDADLRRHLREGRRLFEARLGMSPEYMSLPGGSGSARVLGFAREEGFRVVAGSIPARCTMAKLQPELPRFALRCETKPRKLRSLVEQQPLELAAHWLRYRSLRAVRAALGETLYQRARRAWAQRTAS